MNAELCIGSVMHVRHAPLVNRFRYPLFFLRLPLSQMDGLAMRMLGVNRAAPMRIDFADYGARDGSNPIGWWRALLGRFGIEAGGEFVLQTMPRLFGYVFNPVSFCFCNDEQARLRAVICEVNNTFGERHNYIVAHADRRPIASGDVLWAQKVFHVSPFFPVHGAYRFRFFTRGAVRSVAIDYFDHGEVVLATRLSGRAEPVSERALLRVLLRFPLMGIAVIARIHWQALRLSLRRVKFFRKPQPPLEESTT